MKLTLAKPDDLETKARVGFGLGCYQTLSEAVKAAKEIARQAGSGYGENVGSAKFLPSFRQGSVYLELVWDDSDETAYRYAERIDARETLQSAP